MRGGQRMHWAWLPAFIVMGWITVVLFALVVYALSWVVWS